MAGQFAKLHKIDNWDEITEENHYEFLYHLQLALLLTLKEQGRLNAMQYRYAEDKLKKQRINRAKNILGKGEGQ